MSARPKGPPKMGGEWWLVAYRHAQTEPPAQREWFTDGRETEREAKALVADLLDTGYDPLIYIYRVVIQGAFAVKP